MEADKSSQAGFIGLGKMGSRMAARLLDNGTRLQVFDVSSASVGEAVAKGATECRSPAEVAQATNVIVLMLPNSGVVERVLFGPEGVARSAAGGTVVVDMTSGDAIMTRDFASRLQEHGVSLVDAPVSGGIPAAEAGSLTIMVGGDTSDLERVRPLLEAMGREIVHVGELGSGHILKSLNNALYATSIIASSEALLVAKKLGVSVETALKVFTASSGTNRALETRMQTHVVPRKFESAMSAALMRKDLMYARRLGQDAGVHMPLTSLVEDEFDAYVEDGHGDEVDFGIVRRFEEAAGTTID